MNRRVIWASAISIAVAANAAALAAQSEQPGSGFQPKPYFVMPLEKDPSRQVRLQNVVIPAGAGNQFHRHPGDQWWAVQEGEVTFTVTAARTKTSAAASAMSVACNLNGRISFEGTVRRMPSGENSKNQLTSTATGKPMISNAMIALENHAGSVIAACSDKATCRITHAATT